MAAWLGRKLGSAPGQKVQDIGYYYGEHIYGGVWEGETGWFMSRGQRQIWRVKAMRSRLRQESCLWPLGHGDVLAWAAIKIHVWIRDPDLAAICADVHGSCSHQRPRGQAAPSWPCALTGCNIRESWPWPSCAVALGRADPAPCLGPNF